MQDKPGVINNSGTALISVLPREVLTFEFITIAP